GQETVAIGSDAKASLGFSAGFAHLAETKQRQCLDAARNVVAGVKLERLVKVGNGEVILFLPVIKLAPFSIAFAALRPKSDDFVAIRERVLEIPHIGAVHTSLRICSPDLSRIELRVKPPAVLVRKSWFCNAGQA